MCWGLLLISRWLGVVGILDFLVCLVEPHLVLDSINIFHSLHTRHVQIYIFAVFTVMPMKFPPLSILPTPSFLTRCHSTNEIDSQFSKTRLFFYVCHIWFYQHLKFRKKCLGLRIMLNHNQLTKHQLKSYNIFSNWMKYINAWQIDALMKCKTPTHILCVLYCNLKSYKQISRPEFLK